MDTTGHRRAGDVLPSIAARLPWRPVPRLSRSISRLARVAGLLLVIAVALGGCASLRSYFHTPPAVTVSEVVALSKEGMPPEQIIQKMQKSRTVYRLDAAQLARLREQGVADPVINYMQQTYLNAVRKNQFLNDLGHWGLGWDGYWYGGAPFGWEDHYYGGEI
jgi:hypothetical protein